MKKPHIKNIKKGERVKKREEKKRIRNRRRRRR